MMRIRGFDPLHKLENINKLDGLQEAVVRVIIDLSSRNNRRNSLAMTHYDHGKYDEARDAAYEASQTVEMAKAP